MSVNQLINEAIEEYLEREERRIAFVKSAKERWEHYRLTGERISDEEADQWIERLLHGEDADAQ